MGLQDLVITPFYGLLLLVIAYIIRPLVSNPKTKRYFIPALLLKFFGAVSVGVIYFYYYGGGDTINYWLHGSRWIWEAFSDNPVNGIRMLFSKSGEDVPSLYQYTQNIWYFRESSSYFIVKLAAFFDLITFHTYSATALFFAVIGFSGLWALFTIVHSRYHSRWIAYAILFVPSTIFWGSGILKDTVTLSAICWLTYACYNLIEIKRNYLINIAIVILSALTLATVKVYILMSFIPGLAVWLYAINIKNVRNVIVKVLVGPILLLGFGLVSFLLINQVSSTNDKYALSSISQQAAITAYDIRYGWGSTAGGEGGYDIGVLDGSWGSMFRLFPAAVNVSLFRPYIWEAKNPLMLISAFESTIFMILTFLAVVNKGMRKPLFNDPFILFCITYVLIFSFAVGVSTFNFGSLMRYKIPMLPFFTTFLVVINEKKFKFK